MTCVLVQIRNSDSWCILYNQSYSVPLIPTVSVHPPRRAGPVHLGPWAGQVWGTCLAVGRDAFDYLQLLLLSSSLQ